MVFTYVIEHLEEDEQAERTLPEWVELEYKHMRSLAGSNAQVSFTHLSHPSSQALSAVFSQDGLGASAARASAYQIGVMELMNSSNVPKSRVCLLDPKAEKALDPADGDAFDWFLFGGILGENGLGLRRGDRAATSFSCAHPIGDDPPRDRTAELRKLGFPTRHLGSTQMTTDTALGVTKMVVADKVHLQDIPYIDFPTIVFNARESVEMPFRYIAVNGQPLLPPGMKELLHKDLDRGFEF